MNPQFLRTLADIVGSAHCLVGADRGPYVVEGVQAIDPNGTTYTTWGYRMHGDDQVTTGTPGPIIRARVGDILRFTVSNTGTMPHNVDFHAVTGQGGGARDTTVAPGQTATIEARLLYPGIFMYHCAAGDVPGHIVQGMYGGILVDPASSDDRRKAPLLQDRIHVEQRSVGGLELPAGDAVSQKKVRDSLLALNETLPDPARAGGRSGEVDPVRPLIATASGEASIRTRKR